MKIIGESTVVSFQIITENADIRKGPAANRELRAWLARSVTPGSWETHLDMDVIWVKFDASYDDDITKFRLRWY